jgi:hypothetical protein
VWVATRYWGPHLLSVVGHTVAVMRHYVSTKRLEVLREAHYPVLILTGTEDRVHLLAPDLFLCPFLMYFALSPSFHCSWCDHKTRTCWLGSCALTSRFWREVTWYACTIAARRMLPLSECAGSDVASVISWCSDQHRVLSEIQ